MNNELVPSTLKGVSMQSGKQRHDCLKKENSGMLAIYRILQRELSGSINYRKIGLFSKNALWDG